VFPANGKVTESSSRVGVYGEVIEMMKKPVPLWIVLIVLIVVASSVPGFVFVPNLLRPKPDFELNASTKSETLLAHEDGSFDVEVTSLNNFTGILSASINQPSGLSTFLSVPDAIPLYYTVTIHVQVLQLTVGNYSVTVVVVSGKISHSASVPYVVEGLVVGSSPNASNLGLVRRQFLLYGPEFGRVCRDRSSRAP